MKKLIAVPIMFLTVGILVGQDDKVEKLFDKVEKGIDKGLTETKRISKEIQKEVEPIIRDIQHKAKPVVQKLADDVEYACKNGEKTAGKAVDRIKEAKEQLEEDVRQGVISVDEKLKREERIRAVEKSLEELNKSLKEEKKKIARKVDEIIS